MGLWVQVRADGDGVEGDHACLYAMTNHACSSPSQTMLACTPHLPLLFDQ